ncbi:Histidine-specific methyltransferase EgtD [Rhodococcus sp. RD6.2]|jgi:L-histidine N-alpha-methyltransferase|uniref:L-histidine N(alpha)-methyltransferase n=1 Tax=Rhodococcus sp. RD6.2 TaxID=260936 RepID=UPI00063B0E62|nr:L-histidine N(alpha)-methyltransferase [Rhodococcus sp. RD6.2]CRK49481.1 Histidine-specific methyltransferase EgtD [Rhodococcus sp. RD6.2]
MTEPTIEIHLAPEDLDESLRVDARLGLTAVPKSLPPKWFYDAHGSELFEEITRLPEYYPTRTERELLRASAEHVAEATSAQILVELGSGSSEKTKLLLDAMTAHGSLERYVPQDVSVAALDSSVHDLARRYPRLVVHGIVSDFTDTLHNLPRGGRRMIAFLGGTLGNLVPDERAEFLSSVAEVLEDGEQLLLGVGLVTDPEVMVPAYDDAAGVTAQFNLNVLNVLNTRLGANFDLSGFRHVALWDSRNEWIEMRVQALRPMTVRVPAIDLDVVFDEGEQMRTEISAKFRVEGICKELAAAGFGSDRVWTDPLDRFALILADRTGRE